MDTSRPGNGSFRENRRRLAMSLPPGALAVIATGRHSRPCGPDSAEPWPDFYYLTGLREPRSALIIGADRDGDGCTILFAPPRDEREVLWNGTASASEFPDVRSWAEFEPVLSALAFGASVLYVHVPENPFAPQEDGALVELCRRLLPLHPIDRLAPFIGRLRAEKQPAEVENIRTANSLAARAFRRAIGFIRAGVRGFEVKAEFLYEITRHGSKGFCCPPITAAGPETLTLHWRGDRRAWAGDETALLDFTVEWNGCCADVARCIPVGGAFPTRHKAIYDAVLRVLNQAIATLIPGRLLSECRREVEVLIQHELLRLGILKSSDVRDPAVPSPALRPFFMHQAFHHVGLEVHDPVPSDLPLAAGQILAVEPAIYLPAEGFGIRLENNVLLTLNGSENLTCDLPIESGDIEDLLQL